MFRLLYEITTDTITLYRLRELTYAWTAQEWIYHYMVVQPSQYLSYVSSIPAQVSYSSRCI
jgi:hypothetical protein